MALISLDKTGTTILQGQTKSGFKVFATRHTGREERTKELLGKVLVNSTKTTDATTVIVRQAGADVFISSSKDEVLTTLVSADDIIESGGGSTSVTLYSNSPKLTIEKVTNENNATTWNELNNQGGYEGGEYPSMDLPTQFFPNHATGIPFGVDFSSEEDYGKQNQYEFVVNFSISEENPDDQVLVRQFKISDSDGNSIIVEVRQASGGVTFGVSPTEIILHADGEHLSDGTSEPTVTVTSNAAWTAQVIDYTN